MSAFDTQVGGSHYKNLAIQPTEYIELNGLTFLEGCIVKRITRWRNKDGIKDLEKIKHEVDMLIELEQKRKGTTIADAQRELNERMLAIRADHLNAKAEPAP